MLSNLQWNLYAPVLTKGLKMPDGRTPRFLSEIDFAIFCSETWVSESDVWQAILDIGIQDLAKQVRVTRPDLNQWLVAHIMYNEALNRPLLTNPRGLND